MFISFHTNEQRGKQMYGYDEKKKAEIRKYLADNGMTHKTMFTMRELEQIAKAVNLDTITLMFYLRYCGT